MLVKEFNNAINLLLILATLGALAIIALITWGLYELLTWIF